MSADIQNRILALKICDNTLAFTKEGDTVRGHRGDPPRAGVLLRPDGAPARTARRRCAGSGAGGPERPAARTRRRRHAVLRCEVAKLSDFAAGGEYGAERDVGDSEMPRDGFDSVRAVAQRPLHVARGSKGQVREG